MTRIRCRERRCLFNKNGICISEEIEYEPDAGCLTLELREDLEEEEEFDEDELLEKDLDEDFEDEDEDEEDDEWDEEEEDEYLHRRSRRR